MKCFRHPTQDACGFCDECGKALCHECVSAFKPPLCADCALARSAANTTGEVKTIAIKSAILFVISFIILKVIFSKADTGSPLSFYLLLSLIISGIPWGWSFLSRVFPVTVFGNGGFVIAYYLLKFTGAYLIGLFIMAWHVIKIPYLIHKGKTEKKLFEQIDAGLSNIDK